MQILSAYIAEGVALYGYPTVLFIRSSVDIQWVPLLVICEQWHSEHFMYKSVWMYVFISLGHDA